MGEIGALCHVITRRFACVLITAILMKFNTGEEIECLWSGYFWVVRAWLCTSVKFATSKGDNDNHLDNNKFCIFRLKITKQLTINFLLKNETPL